MYEHMENVLLQIGFLNPENPGHLMRRLRRLFNRAHPDQVEVNVMRGILSAVGKVALTKNHSTNDSPPSDESDG